MKSRLNAQASASGARFLGRKVFSWSLRLSITAAAVIWILCYLDLNTFKDVLISPRWLPLSAMIAAGLVFMFLGALKLWLLIKVFAPANFSLFVSYFFLAVSVGSVAPTVLCDISLLALLKNEGIPTSQGLSAVLVDRVITLAVCVVLFMPCAFLFLVPIDNFLLVSFGLILVLGLISWRWLWRKLMFSNIFRRFPAVYRFQQALSDLVSQHWQSLLWNVGITIIRGIVSGLSIIFAFMAVEQPASLFPTICITNSLSLISLLPITIGGLGVYEGSGILIFEKLGLCAERVLVALTYQRANIIFMSLLILLLSLIFFAVKRRKGWTLIKQPKGRPVDTHGRSYE